GFRRAPSAAPGRCAAAAPPGVERSAAPPPTSAPLPAHGPSGRAAPALCSWCGTVPLLFGAVRSRGGPAPAPPTARSAAAAGAPPGLRPAGAPRPAPGRWALQTWLSNPPGVSVLVGLPLRAGDVYCPASVRARRNAARAARDPVTSRVASR